MPEWRTPLDTLLRSGARASGAMQKGLDDLASSRSGLQAFNPLIWIRLATEIVFATITSRTVSSAPKFDLPIQQLPQELSRPVTGARTPGWAGDPLGAPGPPVAPVPDLLPRKPTTRPEVLQALIDQDVNFHMFSIPEKKGACLGITGQATGAPGDRVGFHVKQVLHRFNVIASAPTNFAPLAARNTTGERVGTCTARWMFMPDDFVQTPGKEPPATKMTLDSPQRFALVDGLFKFGDRDDSFRGTGVGQTFPVTIRGRRQLRVTAIGALSDGFGKFSEHEEGLFIYCGVLDPASGFLGSVTLRIADRQGTLQTTEPLPSLQAAQNPEQGVTWLTIRGESTSAAPLPAQFGPPGMVFQQQVRLIDIDFSLGGPSGLECAAGVREQIGTVSSHITFDPNIAAGAPGDSLPFAVWREFSFLDYWKNPIGGFTAESNDGFALITDLSGVKAIRFGGAGRILRGTGRFAGMSGVITENTLATLDPHVGSSIYTLRIEDPTGRFFSREGVWRDIPVAEVTPNTSTHP